MTPSPSEKAAPSAKQGSFRLDAKTAIVTGGGSGIGRAIAARFAAQGAKIHILDLSLKDAEATCREIGAAGGNAEAHVCDVTDQKQVIGAFQQLAAQGPISILVNNAGISHIGTAESTSEEEFDRVMRVNVKGFYNCARAVNPEHGLDRRIFRAGGSFCVLREQGRSPGHDVLSSPGLSGLQHPLQLHLSSASSHAVCGWLSEKQLSRAGARDL